MGVPLGTLELGPRLGDPGSQGQVFRVVNRPGEAFKRYHEWVLPLLQADVLSEIVAATGDLYLEGQPITYWATWPTATVTDAGRVVGFLMPLLEPAFSMSAGRLVGKDASFSFLAVKPAPFWGRVRLPGLDGRLKLLALLAGVLQQLHHRQLVVGDLSWGNVLWSDSPELRVMLLDCDGVRTPRGTPVSRQLDSPDWDDPLAPAESEPDADRDCYKLALMVLRVLSQDLNARPSGRGGHRLPGLVPQTASAIDGLLVRAAGAVGSRPPATQWRQVLQGRSVQSVTTPAPTPSAPPDTPERMRLAGIDAERRYRPVVPPTAVERDSAVPPEGLSRLPPTEARSWRTVAPQPERP